MIKIANECGQKWYRWSSWYGWRNGKNRWLGNIRKWPTGFAVGPIMVWWT